MAKKRKPATARTQGRKGPVFRWDAVKRQAAQLLAEGELSDLEIATRSSVHERTLRKWKTTPAFAAAVQKAEAALGDVSLRFVISRRVRRLRALEDRWLRMQQVITERAAEEGMANVPGGTSGLLCRTIKQIGGGDNAERVEEFAVDTGLLREMREHEKQAAIEIGQWSEKHEHGGTGGGAIEIKNVVIVRTGDSGSAKPADGVDA